MGEQVVNLEGCRQRVHSCFAGSCLGLDDLICMNVEEGADECPQRHTRIFTRQVLDQHNTPC
jgi:hypothetical protein